MYKYRMVFEKLGCAAFSSHLDTMKTIQRTFLRAGLPVKYSNGFNPHIYLSLLLPLSTGYESLYELCDFELMEDLSDVTLSPGQSSKCSKAILVSKGNTPVLYRIRTGRTSYTWFTTKK